MEGIDVRRRKGSKELDSRCRKIRRTKTLGIQLQLQKSLLEGSRSEVAVRIVAMLAPITEK